MRFRPCIDLHQGKVKQIVGASLRDGQEQGPQENFVSAQPPSWYAARYREDGLAGGHVIQLGPGNGEAAREALAAWPGGLQLGGGVTPENAESWLEAGAGALIVTSYLFAEGDFSPARLQALRRVVPREKLVLDLSCRRVEGGYVVACDRWQRLTSLRLCRETFLRLGESCGEFLVHAVDVEGKAQGIEREIVRLLGAHSAIPATYAGGVHDYSDIDIIKQEGQDRVNVTIGSALDLFGGELSVEEVLRRM